MILMEQQIIIFGSLKGTLSGYSINMAKYESGTNHNISANVGDLVFICGGGSGSYLGTISVNSGVDIATYNNKAAVGFVISSPINITSEGYGCTIVTLEKI